jgi:hypothetical protein
MNKVLEALEVPIQVHFMNQQELTQRFLTPKRDLEVDNEQFAVYVPEQEMRIETMDEFFDYVKHYKLWKTQG